MREPSVYAAIGPRLTHYHLDVEGAVLEERGSVTLPAGVQYAWRHPSKPFVYVVCSDGGLGAAGTVHYACTMRRDADGALALVGDSIPLQWRPLHVSTDRDGRHALITYNDPSCVTVHRIGEDGLLGEQVAEPVSTAVKTAHQALVTPDNRHVVVPLRGNPPEHGRPEDPGALQLFAYHDGRLDPAQVIAPNGGFGFGPRHIDFHPSRPWMYMSIERQNEIAYFTLGDRVDGPVSRQTTLARPNDVKPRQLGGAIHVHPTGRFVYVSNRADGTITHEGTDVFNGGENTIAVFSIDDQTGDLERIQIEDTHGIHVRTFTIDPSGRILIAGNMRSRNVRAGGAVRSVPGGLSVFRIGQDGRLTFVRKYDSDVSKANLFWTGLL